MAKEKIAVAVVGQIYDAMRDGKAFDLEKYTEELNLLHWWGKNGTTRKT